MRKIILLSLLFSVNKLNAQSWDDSVYLTSAGFNRLINNKMGALVTGQSNASNLVNYASFDLAAGSFTFKGSIPIAKSQDSAKFSYLGFKINGDLISDSYTALFQNAKLNTNVSIDGQWDVRCRKQISGYKYFVSDQAVLALKRRILDSLKKYYIDSTYQPIINNRRDSLVIVSRMLINATDLFMKRASIVTAKDTLTLLLNSLPRNLTRIRNTTDSLSKHNSEFNSLLKDSLATKIKMDSLIYVINNHNEFRWFDQEKIYTEYNQKIKSLEDSATITGLKFSWWTLVAGIGKKSYYSFNPAVVFSEQLKKDYLNTFRFGIMWNFYKERSFPTRTILFNIGLIRSVDNNTNLLSTQDILQEKVVKNSLGDTTRKITKTYKAYTDAIVKSKVWSFILNYYFMHSSKKTGLHFFPSFDLYEKGKDLADIGIGYVISFRNTVKDKSIINAEGYIQFQDIFNRLDLNKGFFRRNEIGIRFTLPFNFF